MTEHELDGVCAASQNHHVSLAHAYGRVLEPIVPAGETAPLHTQLVPTLGSVVWGTHFARRDGLGATMADSRTDPGWVMPSVLYAGSTPERTIENPSAEDLWSAASNPGPRRPVEPPTRARPEARATQAQAGAYGPSALPFPFARSRVASRYVVPGGSTARV